MKSETVLEYDGVSQPIAEWALDYGIPGELIIIRLFDGWTTAAAITTPMICPKGFKLHDEKPASRIDPQGIPMLASLHGLDVHTLRARLRHGLSLADALALPKHTRVRGVVGNFSGDAKGPAGVASAGLPENRVFDLQKGPRDGCYRSCRPQGAPQPHD